MELPLTSAGRRNSTLIDNNLSPRPDAANNHNSFAVPPSPRIEQGIAPSPRIGTTPRLGGTPGGHFRKPSDEDKYGVPETPSLWSKVFGGSNSARRPTGGELPTYGKRTPATSHRPFYDDRRAGIYSGFGGPVILLRNILLRPIYLLGRRGPLFPIVAFFVVLLVYLTYSTSPTSQTVKLKMQGAVGPYIPQRAADAIHWRAGAVGGGSVFGADNLLGGGSGRVGGAGVGSGRLPPHGGAGGAGSASKHRSKLDPKDLPPVRRDSRLLLEEGKPHPIPAMMKKAKRVWEALKGRQSKTFAEAVREYKRRHGRAPPKGFDRWYAFAKAHKVLLIDEFDLIEKDLLMYRAFKPATFRRRVEHLAETMDTTWTIRIESGRVVREGPLWDHDRARGVQALMERFSHFLPDMKIVYNGHDGARIAVAAEERIRLEELAKAGQYDEDENPPFWPKEVGPFPHWGYPVFCPPGSAVREEGFDYGYHAGLEATGYEQDPPVEGSIGSVVGDFKGYMNFCDAPHYRHTHCTTSWVFSHHPTPVMPMFTPGVQATFGDVHALIIEQLELEAKHDPTWEERPFTSLQWRGQTSGPLWEKMTPWRTTQRSRLHLLSHQEDGRRNITVTDEHDVMRSVEVPNYRVNPLFLDTGMVGPAVQCVQEDGTCDKMFEVFQGYDKRISFDRASLYKYVLDVDGNSWSGRFRRLMLSNAAVVKATIFPEFWTDWCIPWLHFIPMQ
ncbi:hypothetical protein JCM6882_004185, partial [Rhodosporidiobolus microsporus]